MIINTIVGNEKGNNPVYGKNLDSLGQMNNPAFWVKW